ncbi:leguminosin group485 secreted peptide [Medicago truncatula]|uniref:Leguminosin group485 secreted peptide n=1 Tax=Medicago truncatula TaxID=3880 RepID=A0A072TNU5_MEDTR|nr:leguminosin group485 secreted peptide [Medicago truncatula]
MFSKVALLIQGLLIMVILISSIGEARNLVEVATKQNNVDGIKYCTKTNGKDNVDAGSDYFIPGFPGVPGIPFPKISGIPDIPGIPFTKIPGIPDFPFPFPGIPGWPDISIFKMSVLATFTLKYI